MHRLSAGYEIVEFVIPRSRLRAARCCLMKSEVPLEGVLRVRARRMAVEGACECHPECASSVLTRSFRRISCQTLSRCWKGSDDVQ
jgi:hypothetical protein